MNPMQIMAMLQNSGNPMMMLTQLAQQNPMMSRAMQMGQGKNEMQLKEMYVNREGYLNQSQIARKARNHAGCGLFLYLRYFQKVSTAHRK